jgi:hypothetical protein
MMYRSATAACLALCVIATAYGQVGVDIALKTGSSAEAQTREQLQRLLRTYDLSQWTFTKSIVIDERAIPHSHPVLTLSTRHLRDDELLLSTVVHEQLHWFLVQRQKDTDAAIKELRTMFPTVPARPPEGAQDDQSTYLHLLVCYLEYRADQRLLGELKTRQVMEFWATDHYTWVYRTVLERTRDIAAILTKDKLIPSPSAPQKILPESLASDPDRLARFRPPLPSYLL